MYRLVSRSVTASPWGRGSPSITAYPWSGYTPMSWRLKGSSLGGKSPYEYLEDLRLRFQKQPLRYKTLPTGEIEAIRSMEAPDVTDPTVRRLMGRGDLTGRWILPKGGFTDEYNPEDAPRAVARNVPSSDVERQAAYAMGVSNISQPAAYQSPYYFAPSAFSTPWREPSYGRLSSQQDPYAQQTPVFGATIDYSKGRMYGPQRTGYWGNEFSRFDPAGQRPARFGGLIPKQAGQRFRFSLGPYQQSLPEAWNQYRWLKRWDLIQEYLRGLQ